MSVQHKSIDGIVIGPGKTPGVHSKMARAVERIGQQSKYYGKCYLDLLALRETADYDPDPVEKSDLEELLDPAQRIRDFHFRRSKD